MKYLLVLIALVSQYSFGHGDHSTPGTLPSGINGGVVGEAHIESEKHDHSHKEKKKHSHEKEEKHSHTSAKGSMDKIFFECTFVNGVLKIFPLKLEHSNSKVFRKMDPTLFNDVEIIVSNPRKKVEINRKFETFKDYWGMNLSQSRVHRIIIKIRGKLKNMKYKSRIQVEKLR